jgi:two-component system response regulator YesN
MTALIVDDQIHIIDGLVNGVCWHDIGITRLYTADSAAKAREIILTTPVDLLLCDIEMPGESGISLLSWIRKNGYGIECIFLTAHADFMYAKEAIQLDCYDYILQPARYEDVRLSASRVIERIKTKQKEAEYTHLGKKIIHERDHILQKILKDWMSGSSPDLSAVLKQLASISIPFSAGMRAHYLLVQTLSWRQEAWDIHKLEFALQNILQEILQPQRSRTVSAVLDGTTIGILVYSEEALLPSEESMTADLQKLYLLCSDWFKCDICVYWYPDMVLSESARVFQLAADLKMNNISHSPGICSCRQLAVSSKPSYVDVMSLQLWEKLLNDGQIKKLEEHITQYLCRMAASRQLNKDTLLNFWTGFLQIVFSVLQKQELTLRDMIPSQPQRDQILLTPTGFEEAVCRLQAVLRAFQRQEEEAGNAGQLVSQIREYVKNHLDQPLTCFAIAETLFMNPNYLSRIFKQQTGISLKEYITKKKMEKARILIQTTNLPISIIAAKVGFDNFSHFSQVYKKVYGITASDARK